MENLAHPLLLECGLVNNLSDMASNPTSKLHKPYTNAPETI